jgi:hypothetical protein
MVDAVETTGLELKLQVAKNWSMEAQLAIDAAEAEERVSEMPLEVEVDKE